MRVLLAASEVAPIIKLGGLGDVVGSLPKALQRLGVNIDVIVPFFPVADTNIFKIEKLLDMHVPFGGESFLIKVFTARIPVRGTEGVDVYLLKNDKVFSIGGQDAFANNLSETEMFMFFSKAVVEFVKVRLGMYDIVHCNDWHTGLITHLLSDELGLERPATVFTIHNIKYQGIGDEALLENAGLVPGTHPMLDWDTEDGSVNLMQQGIMSADYINAVSPSYAKEIMTPKFGGGFVDILKAREGRLSGILNGLDYSQFPRNYDVYTCPQEKPEFKKTLQEKLGLEVCDKPVFSFISRLDPNQKGLDILHSVIPDIVKRGGQFILLGVGEKEWEGKFHLLAPDKSISINTVFDVALARQMYEGSDFLLAPSKYEPCGLIQMIAMWYGTLPVVHGVGGLKDSVTDGKNGFVFKQYTAKALLSSIEKALKVYGDRQKLNEMVTSAITTDFSWEKSAEEYKKLYESAVATRKQ
ncbi:MAG: glycogen/starch synthase [Patescibacteria group bacterium]|jgi:starch synthase